MAGEFDFYTRLAYEDVDAAAAWLVRVFGFVERERKGGIIWLDLGSGTVMISGTGFGMQSPKQLGGYSHKLNVYLDDVRTHYERAVAEGAQIERELADVEYGERRYEAFDLEGHRWHFTQRL